MQNLVITKKGQELMAKMIAGTSTATFTKICTSDYDYSSVNLEELLEMYDIKQEALVSKVSRTDLTIVEVLAAINNSNLKTGYYVRGIGLYAKDSDNNEILYGISIDSENPDYLPAFGGQTVSGISYRLNTKVDNSEQVTLELNPAAIPTIEQVELVDRKIDSHTNLSINSESGVHGFRFYNDVLQFYNEESKTWIDIETGGGGIAPSNVKNPKIKVGNGKLTLLWDDPGDTVVDGQIICTWKGTKLIQKLGAFPENIKDGTLILDNQIKGAYSENGFEINNLTNGTTYYFGLFPYSDKNVVNENQANKLNGTPQPYKRMTVEIDLSNSNPASSITYKDDAIGMTPGSSAWDEFFGHYPCLFKNGAEVGKLKRDDYSKFEDGTNADITSGNAGDVMVAFPRRGVKIDTVGNILTISMTDDPDNADYKYYAHSRNTERKDKFYLGAYKSFKDSSNKLRSLSGKTITANQTIGTFRTQAQANGTGYEQSGFYQLMFRQVMYLLKYKNLDSQTSIGKGHVNMSSATTTGNTNLYGMDSEIIKTSNPSYMTDGKHQVKAFGLEDFWGNVYEWIDGMCTNSTNNILTATTGFNDSGSGYKDNGQGVSTSGLSGWMSKPQGKTETGFLLKEASGSGTTYFCDYADLSPSYVAYFGGYWSDDAYAGAFSLRVVYSASYYYSSIAARLMYL